jgi:hypothetical protein
MMNANEYKQAKDFLKKSYSVKSVQRGTYYYTKFLLAKCQNIFLYENLPETLPAWEIEKNLIIKGNGAVIKKDNNLYIPFTGNVYGYDAYMVPNKFTFANPVIGGGSNLEDMKNCAIIWNSDIDKINFFDGSSWLWETIKRYARMLADLESSFANNLVYSRSGLITQAATQTTADAMQTTINKLEAGDVSTVLNKQILFDDIKPMNFGSPMTLNQFTEARDYLLNCFYNTIGLQTLEEKKERMITDEINVDNGVLLNNIDIMYKTRVENVEKINKLFNTDIKVFKNSITGGV